MNYKISICHPDKAEIEEPKTTLDKQQVLTFFSNYPWMERIEFADNMPQEEVQYSPSIRFTNTQNKRSLEMTADKEDSALVFSLWYERPVLVKILFGLFGKTKIMKVVDKGPFDKQASFIHLNTFLDKKYDELERIMT